jgi:hypothetical protein
MEENNLKQRYAMKFCVQLRKDAIDTWEKFRKRLLKILCHVLKYFGGTNILYMDEKR